MAKRTTGVVVSSQQWPFTLKHKGQLQTPALVAGSTYRSATHRNASPAGSHNLPGSFLP